MLVKCFEWFLMGLCFGAGFIICAKVMAFIGSFLVGHQPTVNF
jgi:hypothetical protein